MRKRKKRGLIPAACIAFFLYIVLFPSPLSKEIILDRSWHINLSDDILNKSKYADERNIGFRIGKMFGYFNLSGNISLYKNVHYDVTLSDNGFINYSALHEKLIFQNLAGEFESIFISSGYPVLDKKGERVFIIKKDSTGIEEFNRKSEKGWRREFASLITSLSISKKNILIGLLNGNLKLFDSNGSIEYEIGLKNSRIPVVYGCALDNDGNNIAGISGLYPQQLFFIKRIGHSAIKEYYTKLNSNFRREVFICFSKQGKYLFFERNDGLGVMDIDQKKDFTLPFDGELAGLQEDENNRILSFISEKENKTTLYVYRLKNVLIHKENLPYKDVFIKQIDKHIILGFAIPGSGSGAGAEGKQQTQTHILRVDLKEI